MLMPMKCRCGGEVFTEGPRRVFTQGVSLRELDQSKSTLVLKGSQKEVLCFYDPAAGDSKFTSQITSFYGDSVLVREETG